MLVFKQSAVNLSEFKDKHELISLGQITDSEMAQLFRPHAGADTSSEQLGDVVGDSTENSDDHQTRNVTVDMEIFVKLLNQAGSVEALSPVLNDLPAMLEAELPVTEDINELEKAIRIRKDARGLFGHWRGGRKILLLDLAVALRRRFELQGDDGDLKDLDEAVALYHEIIESAASEDEDGRYRFFGSLARTFKMRYQRTHDVADLAETIKYYETAFYEWPQIHDNSRAFDLFDYAGTLQLRFDRCGEMSDLDSAIENHRKALHVYSSDSLIPQINTYARLCQALLLRAEKLHQVEDAEEAMAKYADALDILPSDHEALPPLLCEAGIRICQNTILQKVPSNVKQSIIYLTKGLELAERNGENEAHVYDCLGIAYLVKFTNTLSHDDLNQSIIYQRRAVNLSRPDVKHHPDHLSTLSSLLATRYDHQTNVADLEEAITISRQSLDLVISDAERRTNSQVKLANLYQKRYRKFGTAGDIDTAISLARDAAASLTSEALRGYIAALNTLAQALLVRFEHAGDLGDADEAIKFYREVAQELPSEGEARVSALQGLADVYCARATLVKEENDLDVAVSSLFEVLRASKPEEKEYPRRLLSLSHALGLRNKAGESGTSDAEIAQRCLEQALSLCPDPHPLRTEILNQLAHTLRRLSASSGKTQQLESMNRLVNITREVISGYGTDHDSYPRGQFCLGSALRARYDLTEDPSDLEAAVPALVAATNGLYKDHPLQGPTLFGLAYCYLGQAAIHQNPEYVDMAFACCEKGTSSLGCGSMVRFYLARGWASDARRLNHNSALRGYSTALSLLDRYIMVSHTIETRHKTLSNIQPSFVLSAASCAIEHQQLETAVELLEQGRALLWSQVARYRTPMERLKASHSELAEEFRRLSLMLERGVMSSDTTGGEEGPKYRQLTAQWEAIVTKIRQIPEFSDFLIPTPYSTLREASARGPVIIINIDTFRSDAIIILHDSSPLLVALPNATPDAITTLSSNLRDIIQVAGEYSDCTRNSLIMRVLRKVWEYIVGPIVETLLNSCRLKEGSRIWWCPTSMLWSLPLHATGPYKAGERNLPDIFVSSYTPTLSALRRSDKPASFAASPPTMLVVAQPQSSGHEPLPHVKEEVAQITTLSPLVDVLENELATRDAVIRKLQQCPWVHFACHGHQDISQPFNSRFSLYNESLTLIDIAQNGLPRAEFAFLSACHSAAGDQKNLNEAIHLAAGLQFSGFGGVVGTMWAMADMDGPVMAREFYGYMFQNSPERVDYHDAAIALNRATKAMRKMGVPMDRWINFLHIGA